MKPAGIASRRFPSKFLLTVVPGLVASGVAASVLYAIHIPRTPPVSEYLSEPTPQNDGLSAEERRDLTRTMMRVRRENPETPVEVQPVPDAPMDGDGTTLADTVKSPDGARTLDARTPDARTPDARTPDARTPDARTPDSAKAPDTRSPDTRTADAKPGDVRTPDNRMPDVVTIRPPDVAIRTPDNRTPDNRTPDVKGGGAAKVPDRPAQPDHVVTAPPLTAPPVTAPPVVGAPLPPPRPLVRRPDPPVTPPPPVTTVAVPPPHGATPPPVGNPMALSGPPGAQTTAGGQQPPVVTATAPPPPPPQRGFGENMLSGLSSVAGSAANATGNTVNWMINLPGKAINAGGKLIGIKKDDDQAGAPPPAGPPPATAPPAR